jgi:hypothetical protein
MRAELAVMEDGPFGGVSVIASPASGNSSTWDYDDAGRTT